MQPKNGSRSAVRLFENILSHGFITFLPVESIALASKNSKSQRILLFLWFQWNTFRRCLHGEISLIPIQHSVRIVRWRIWNISTDVTLTVHLRELYTRSQLISPTLYRFNGPGGFLNPHSDPSLRRPVGAYTARRWRAVYFISIEYAAKEGRRLY